MDMCLNLSNPAVNVSQDLDNEPTFNNHQNNVSQTQ